MAQSSNDSTDNFGIDYVNNAQLFTIGYPLQNKISLRDYWFLDSGATEHMSFRRDWFAAISCLSKKNLSVLKEIDVKYIHSTNQLAHLLTKALPKQKLQKFVKDCHMY